MIPLRLEIKNFLAYRAPDALRFDGIHLACLTGANGAGKSSLLDAITWVLWGKARAKRDDELIHLGQQEMHIQLDFRQEDVIYRVIRKRSRKSRGVGTLDFFSQIAGEWVTQTEPSMRETQEKINRILRLDYETFVHSAFLQQGKADAFMTKPPAQRKQILADMLGLAQWTVYEDQAKEALRKIEQELEMIAMRLSEIERELRQEPQLRQVVSEAEKAQQEAQTLLTAAEERLQVVASAPAELRAAQERQAEAERTRKHNEQELGNTAQEIERGQRRMADYAAILAATDEIAAGYAALQSARAADSALADKLFQLSQFEADKRALETQLLAARSALENEISAIQARMAELQAAQTLSQPDELAAVQSQVVKLQTVQINRAELDSTSRSISEEKATLEGMLKTRREEGQAVRERLERLKETTAPDCPLCGQPLTEQHRADLVAELEAEIEARRVEYATTQEQIKTLTAHYKTQQQEIRALDTELTQLGSLMEQAGVLQAQIDAAESAQARWLDDEQRLKQLGSTLEHATYAPDVRAALAELEAQQSEIGYDRTTHEAAREQLKTVQAYDARQKQLELAQASLPDVQAALAGWVARQERLHSALREDAEKVAALVGEINQLRVLVAEEKTRRDEVNRLRTAERVAYSRLTQAQQELNTLANQRKRQAELHARQETRRADQGRYDTLRQAFGKNGVPALLIESAIPELETEANELLAQMTAGRMQLKFSTQREKAAGDGVIETLEIEIADELGTRSYELYSGGETFRINFAVRVALARLLARRAGAQLRTLFIDEGFGTQDEEGRNRLVEAITAIQDYFELILVITHLDDLRDSFPVHVVVQKTPQGSRIAVR